MNWKEDYIDDESEVEGFLRRHMSAHASNEPVNVKVESEKKSFHAHASTAANRGSLSFSIDGIGSSDLELHSVHASKGHGAMALKCALAVAYGRGCNSIILGTVRKDGLSFWPYHGSLPYSIGVTNAINPFDLGHFLKDNAALLDEHARAEVEKIRQVSEYSTLWAWRLLSQSPVKLNDSQFVRNVIFRNVERDEYHVILPGEPGTRKILNDRIGVIPPFRSDTEEGYVRELAQMPKEIARLVA